MTRNIALTLRYDGTRYHGWQIQKNVISVCGTVQNALSQICGHEVSLMGCGRTDAGVHAERYTANFRTSSTIPAERLPFALNSNLPDDIAALDARDVEYEFHSVFSCVRKEYTYRLYHSAHRDPLLATRSLHYPKKPQLEAWRNAAENFLGTHDFAAVRSMNRNPTIKNTIRTVYAFDVYEEFENHFAFRIAANGFLYNMARAMVGTVLYAGLGKIESVPELLASLNRTAAGPTLPPYGLYMTNAEYP
ncbi:MAG: tRNA pseudouridine(38-40) synthase TruA [Oscillospiraceae bacterium]|nr:tRNA pseudouridine(38-40) synthase TruA [Oscillospiraceae bacterium]